MEQEEMYLDEKLALMEAEERRKKAEKERLDEIREKIAKDIEEQKPVETFLSEMEEGKTEIDGKEFFCEHREYLDGLVRLWVFPEDMGEIHNNADFVNFSYRQLETSVTLYRIPDAITVCSAEEYQEKVNKQMHVNGLPYQPMKEGSLISGGHMLHYVIGSIYSAAGGIYQLIFYTVEENNAIIGNFSCLLRKHIRYENCFLAMIQGLYEEDKNERLYSDI